MDTTYEHPGNVTAMYAAREQMTAAIKSAPLGRVDRKIALLRYVERLPLPDIAAQTHYSRTAVGYRLKGIEKVFE